MHRALRISHATAQALSPAQKRFSTLLQRIEGAQANVAAGQQNLPVDLNAHAAVVVPLAEHLASRRGGAPLHCVPSWHSCSSGCGGWATRRQPSPG